jgi:heme/copper-type cytochrome/quinol oxidase subunit 3
VTNLPKPTFRAPRRASIIGLYLFLAALGMLFFASLLLYVLLRFQIFGQASADQVRLSPLAWLSTAILLSGSFTIHLAVSSVRIEHQATFRKYLYLSMALAVLFLVVQTPCMADLLRANHRLQEKFQAQRSQNPTQEKVPLYGLAFCLVLLHALHVLGGIVALVWVTIKASRGKYDHEHYLGVQFAARYWHFLDAVWIIMFAMFLALP